MTDVGKTGSGPSRRPIVLEPRGGRDYPMGRLNAVFKADAEETQHAYSISEWWLEPNTAGPGAHSHAEDDVFFVLEGTMSILIDQDWVEAPQGTFVLVPGGVTHDFQNRSAQRAGMLNFTNGAFEPEMTGIQQWFLERSAREAIAV